MTSHLELWSNLVWDDEVWIAPDGKEIPYKAASFTHESWDNFEVSIHRYPKNTRVVLRQIYNGDDYTNDGDGDGVISSLVAITFGLLRVSNIEIDSNPADFMQRVYEVADRAYYELVEAS